MKLSSITKHIKGNIPEHFKDDPGVEAYNLYAQTSQSLKKGKIADLGTYQGLSALALAINPNVQVYSYDIDLSYNLVEKENITFIQGNVFGHITDILTCDIILVDLDPHNGIQERNFLDVLIEENYKGITLWDDIHLNSGMEQFWNSVELPKEDISNIGHHSGTGKIIFLSRGND